MSDGKTHLIVTGVARSGTTALGELLNSHPGICLGIERFKFQFLRANNYSGDLFSRDRFFDFREDDTNLRPDKRPAWKPIYDRIDEKWDDATIIGDKVPDMLPILTDFIAANPDFRYICILRNLKDVALSWQARADKTRDAWPAAKDFAAACASWGAQMETLNEMMRNKALRRKVMLLDYDTMYADPAQTSAALLAYLDLPASPEFSATLAEHAEFANSRTDRKVPKRFLEAYQAIDQSYMRGLRKIAREQAALLSVKGGVTSS